jgi:hypothetical protein
MLVATKGIWASPNFDFFGKTLNGPRAQRVKKKNVVVLFVLVGLKMVGLFAYHLPAKFKYIDKNLVPSSKSLILNVARVYN